MTSTRQMWTGVFEMTTAEAIKLLQMHDYTLPARVALLPPTFAVEVRPSLATLDNEAAEIAAECLAKNPKDIEAARTLLTIIATADLQPSSTAARSLADFTVLPPAKDLLTALASVEEPAVRAILYFLIGRTDDATQLETLRVLVPREKDEPAAGHGQAAEVRLGGKPERDAFINRISAATGETVFQIREEMLHVGDVKLARAMLPWLDNTEPVLRMGGDRLNQPHARMQDVAVWIARELNVPDVPLEPKGLNVFDAMTLHMTRVALQRLPA